MYTLTLLTYLWYVFAIFFSFPLWLLHCPFRIYVVAVRLSASLLLNGSADVCRVGVRYEQGGVGTGFKHVETNAQGEKRLFQVKGKRNVRVRQVNLSVSSMNKGDCFILDAGNEIYVYVGSQAKRVEKLKAISAANQIRDQDHNGRARVQIIGK